ncbi:MAG: hypothetical protein MI974_20665 [Chitinophagales bacterium]|nr:hypothetical protein [Chitinophagales bacterium]
MLFKKVLFPLLLFFFSPFPSFSYEVLTEWKLDREEEGIRIYYRLVKINEKLTTRQMKISFQIKAEASQVLYKFKDIHQFSQWTVGAKSCKLLRQFDDNWVVYSRLDIPWPFEQKDQITEYQLVQSPQLITLKLTARPKYLPPYQGITRMDKYKGKWLFKPTSNGYTEVEFHSLSYKKASSLPKVVRDPIIQNAFIDAISKLRNMFS